MNRKMQLFFLSSTLIPCLLLHAADLPTPLKEVKPEMKPLGSATLHWFGMHIYDIALYAQEAPYKSNITAILSIRYNVSIKHRRLVDTTLKEWRKIGIGNKETIEEWKKLLDSLWPDVKPGNSLVAFKRQDGPTQFYFGEKLLGEVADANFGPAFFAIWLDNRCSHPEVRDELLGKKKKGS